MSKLSKILKSEMVLPLTKQCALNVLCTNNFLEENFSLLFKSHQLTKQQYNVLRILRGQKGNPVNLSAIQDRNDSSQSAHSDRHPAFQQLQAETLRLDRRPAFRDRDRTG